MKKVLLFASLALCIASCMHTTNNTASERPSLYGDWVSENYINALKKLKSTREAQDKVGSLMFCFMQKSVDSGILVADFHTAGPAKLYKEDGGYYYRGDYIRGGDTVEHMRFIGTDTMVVNGARFIKIAGDTEIDETPLVAEEFLFSGTYTRENGKQVEFKLKGKITGLDTITQYSTVLDYGDAGLNLDEIVLGSDKKSGLYGFKFNGDTLKLYQLNCEVYDTNIDMCAVYAWGKLLYKLHKIK